MPCPEWRQGLSTPARAKLRVDAPQSCSPSVQDRSGLPGQRSEEWRKGQAFGHLQKVTSGVLAGKHRSTVRTEHRLEDVLSVCKCFFMHYLQLAGGVKF